MCVWYLVGLVNEATSPDRTHPAPCGRNDPSRLITLSERKTGLSTTKLETTKFRVQISYKCLDFQSIDRENNNLRSKNSFSSIF